MTAVAQLAEWALGCPVDVLPARTGFLGAPAPVVVLRYDDKRSGLSTVVPDGAYRGTVSWTSHDIFMKGLRAFVKAHPEMRRNTAVKHVGKDVIAEDTFIAGIEMLAAAAAHGTGRGVQVSKKTIAEALGCSLKTVQRIARIASRVVQCLVMIVQGRELTEMERIGPDGVWRQIPIRGQRLKQHGVPPVWAFHVPAWLRPFMLAAAIKPPPVDNQGSRRTPSDLQRDPAAPLPFRAAVPSTSNLPYNSPSEPTSSKSGSLRSPSGPGSARTAPTRRARPSPGHLLAVEAVKTLAFLRSESTRRVQGNLTRFAESRPVWTAQDLSDAIRTLCEQLGLSFPQTADCGWALLDWFLKQIHEQADHPRLATIDPAELRCGRTECDHGLIVDAGCNPQRRCDQCRPGAWPQPSSEELAAQAAVLHVERDDDRQWDRPWSAADQAALDASPLSVDQEPPW